MSIKMSIRSIRTLTIQYLTVNMLTQLLSFIYFKCHVFQFQPPASYTVQEKHPSFNLGLP